MIDVVGSAAIFCYSEDEAKSAFPIVKNRLNIRLPAPQEEIRRTEMQEEYDQKVAGRDESPMKSYIDSIGQADENDRGAQMDRMLNKVRSVVSSGRP